MAVGYSTLPRSSASRAIAHASASELAMVVNGYHRADKALSASRQRFFGARRKTHPEARGSGGAQSAVAASPVRVGRDF